VALILADALDQAPQPDVAQIKAKILHSVDPVRSLDRKTVSGGRLNVWKALNDPGDVSPIGGGGGKGRGNASGNGSSVGPGLLSTVPHWHDLDAAGWQSFSDLTTTGDDSILAAPNAAGSPALQTEPDHVLQFEQGNDDMTPPAPLDSDLEMSPGQALTASPLLGDLFAIDAMLGVAVDETDAFDS
jgi:hypothetical protein